MKTEDKLKQKFGTDTGFRVPDGYFDHVFTEIDSKLPEHPGLRKRVPLSRWQRIKPYVYLAAMFGGIWCTMKMISMMSDTKQEVISLDNPPELVAQAMETPEVVAQVYSTPSVVLIDDEDIESYSYSDNSSSASSDDDDKDAPTIEMPSEYTRFVNASDIDLAQLQAALYAEDTDDDYYYYI